MIWVIVIIILSGCLGDFQNMFDIAANQYKAGKQFNLQLLNDLNVTNGTIYAFVCNYTEIQKRTGIWGWIDRIRVRLGANISLFDRSLLGAKCWFENVTDFPNPTTIFLHANMTEQEMEKDPNFKVWDNNKLVPNKDITKKRFEGIVTFGLVSGPTTADFNNLNPYCNNSLGYPVKIIKSTTEEYLVPSMPVIKAACFLDLGYIPIFVFRGPEPGKFPNVDNSGILAYKLCEDENGAIGECIGPVMLFTDSQITNDWIIDDNKWGRVYAQIYSWRYFCKKCLIGLSVPFDFDENALIKLKQRLDEKYPFPDDNGTVKNMSLLEAIDMIGFGLDVERLEDKCSVPELISRMDTLIGYAQLLGKPTLIYYLNIPDQTIRCKDGRSIKWNDSIIWPDGLKGSRIDRFYRELYRPDTIGMNRISNYIAKGLIGLPTPPLYSISGRIIFGNGMGLLDGNSTKETIFSHTLYFCKRYREQGFGSIVSPILFTNSPNYIRNIEIMSTTSSVYNINQDPHSNRLTPIINYSLGDKDDELFQCIGCIGLFEKSEINFYKRIYNLDSYKRDCDEPKNIIDKLKVYSDILDIDVPYIRALIEALSDFNQNYCSVYNDPYFPKIEICGHDISSYKSCNNVCGIGIVDVKVDFNREKASPCGEGVFDPFDLEQNLCKGMLLLYNASQKASSIIDQNQYTREYMSPTSPPKDYLINRLFLTAIIYNGYFRLANHSAIHYVEVRQMLDVTPIGDESCEDGLYYEYCCDKNNKSVNPFCSSNITYSQYLLGVKYVAENIDSSRNVSFAPVPYDYGYYYSKLKFGMIVMSKYLSAYEKCEDCYSDNWAENLKEKKNRICKQYPNLPICHQ